MFSKFLIFVLPIGLLASMVYSSNGQDGTEGNKIELSAQENALLDNYQGDVKLPSSLVRAYAQFVKAAGEPTVTKLAEFTLPYSVAMTTAVRDDKTHEYGTDMNLPFLKTKFHKQILNLRMESECCYLLRTGSSYIRYIKTAAGNWKIYNYGDKPID